MNLTSQSTEHCNGITNSNKCGIVFNYITPPSTTEHPNAPCVEFNPRSLEKGNIKFTRYNDLFHIEMKCNLCPIPPTKTCFESSFFQFFNEKGASKDDQETFLYSIYMYGKTLAIGETTWSFSLYQTIYLPSTTQSALLTTLNPNIIPQKKTEHSPKTYNHLTAIIAPIVWLVLFILVVSTIQIIQRCRRKHPK